MYSTSSSECVCDDCTCMNDVYDNQAYGRSPFYRTMGQPLVYYAQMPPPPKIQRSRESRKENRNCFSKAFRWYTQERLPHQTISSNKTDMSAFATWLDSKYEEFLRDSQLDSPYHLKLKQTTVIEAERNCNNPCCEPRKKFRVKSPWKKKQRNSSKEAGDTIQKPTQSFQFILQPKDLARHASECRQPSNSTMISSEIPVKYPTKSQSYTMISQEPANNNTCEQKPENDADKSKKDILNVKVSQHITPHSISCQCSSVQIVKVHAQSQYEDMDTERVAAGVNQITNNKILFCQPCPNNTLNNDFTKMVLTNIEVPVKAPSVKPVIICKCSKELTLKVDSPIQWQAQNTEQAPSLSNIQSSTKMGKTCPCESYDEFKVENTTNIPSLITFSNGGVQTSDHSIYFEKDDLHGYPLFMKIICADRLCK